jgi:hypothetical protein
LFGSVFGKLLLAVYINWHVRTSETDLTVFPEEFLTRDD